MRPLALALVVLLMASAAFAQDKPAPKPKEGGRSQLLSLPIPVDREVRGIKIPYYTAEGRLEMNFDATAVRRIDETHLKLSHMRVEFFNTEGQSEMEIRLPASILDLETEIITSKEEAFIKRPDFQMNGQSLTFNTRTRKGKMTGKIQMIIFDRTNLTTDSK